MKKILLLTTFIALMTGLVFAQTFKIETLENLDVTNSSVNMQSNDLDLVLDKVFQVTNISNQTVELYVKKREAILTAGSSSYFCLGLCYAPTANFSDTIQLCSGCVLEGLTEFSVHFRPRGYAGESQVVYTIIPVSNEADSVTVTMNYSIGEIGAPEFKPLQSVLYPNPASSVVSIEYPFKATTKNFIKISNVLGSEVKRLPISNPSGVNSFTVADLMPGVYFYTIYDGGNVVKTNRLVIKR